MSNMVTIRNGDFFYVIPQHEFVRYWMPHMGPFIVEKVPVADLPRVSVMAALKRGKGAKRVEAAMNQKGSGKHDPLRRV